MRDAGTLAGYTGYEYDFLCERNRPSGHARHATAVEVWSQRQRLSRRRHHTVVDTIGAIGWVEPGSAAVIIGSPVICYVTASTGIAW